MGSKDDGRYRGLLIDHGGVLTTSLFESFTSFCELERLAPETLAKRFRSDPACRGLLIGLETGRLAEEEFEPRLAAMLDVEASGLIDRMFASVKPEEQMISAVRALRAAGIRTGLVSNSWGTRRYDRAQLAELFDGTVISGDVGIRKPAPEMYSLGAQRIGVAPERCVFVDDLTFNLDPAAELGMATVHHRTAEQTIAQLEELFEIELHPRVRPG
jgi:epoxide hydrolase-like predicted phosphatase